MGNRQRIARIAVERGDFTLLMFEDVIGDGVFDDDDALAMRVAMTEWQQATRAANTAQALGEALSRGVGAMDGRYLMHLVDGYQAAIDELPQEAA